LRAKTAAELIRQRAEEAAASWKARKARALEEAAQLVAAYRAAVDALTEAEGVAITPPSSGDDADDTELGAR
jgi:hypothetical protein